MMKLSRDSAYTHIIHLAESGKRSLLICRDVAEYDRARRTIAENGPYLIDGRAIIRDGMLVCLVIHADDAAVSMQYDAVLVHPDMINTQRVKEILRDNLKPKVATVATP